MIDRAGCAAGERSPDTVSGEWRFRGTRVPLHALFENAEGGVTVDELLEWCRGVQRRQVDAVLANAQRSLEAA